MSNCLLEICDYIHKSVSISFNLSRRIFFLGVIPQGHIVKDESPENE